MADQRQRDNQQEQAEESNEEESFFDRNYAQTNFQLISVITLLHMA